MSEDYIQLPPDGTGKKVRAIRRPDNRYEEVMVPYSKDGTVDLKDVYSLLEKLTKALATIATDTLRVGGNKNTPFTQREATYELVAQLAHQGTEIDPRIITDVEKVADVTKYLSPTSLTAGGTATLWTPATGKKIRFKRVQVSVDAPTRIDLRWGTTPFESYYLPANGSIIFNAIGVNEEGAVDESLTLLSSADATVTASAKGDEI